MDNKLLPEKQLLLTPATFFQNLSRQIMAMQMKEQKK
jgi:hypothetical protein